MLKTLTLELQHPIHHLGFKKKLLRKRLLYKHFFPPEISSAIITFHAITGADAVSSLCGHLNIKIKKSPKAQKLIYNLGKHDIMKCSKHLVIYIYGDKGSTK